MALRPSGMTNDQWKQLSSAMEPNVDDAGKKLAVAKAAHAALVAPEIQQPQSSATSVGRSLGDFAARAIDLSGTPLRAQLDMANAAAMYGRNVVRGALGKPALEPAQLEANRVQNWLAALRASNTAPVASTTATPAPRPQIPAVAAPSSPTQQTARTATQPPASPPTGMGVPAGAGGAAPIRPGDPNTFTGTNGITRRVPMPGTMDAATNQSGNVQSQNFGNPVVPQAQASIASPRVASTFGMSVNDPRLNDQAPQSAAIAQPTQNPPRPQSSPFDAGFAGRMSGDTTAIARPGANFRMTVPNGVSYRSADAMAEAYNSREDREARQKVLSDLDSQRFRLEMIAGNPGRRGRAALDALGQNAQQQAALAAGGEKLSADAVQGRASRNNVLANTGMEQAGQTQRQQMAGDVASQGQFLDYDAKNRATNASLIDKPQYVTDRSGNLVQVAGGKGAGVTGADGAVIKMPQTTKVDNDALSAVSKELTALINNPPEMGADATAYNNRLAELRAQQSAFLGGGQQPAQVTSKAQLDALPKGARYIAPDGKTYTKN